MAKIDLADEVAQRLRTEAAAAGQPLDAFVSELLDAAAFDLDDSADVEAFLRTGEAIPAQNVVDWLEAGGDASGLPFPKPRPVR
ncbi:MAG: hypothetical protein IV086_00920 [Hyphomonadaceae bacterium]|nr:MAG: hypothetical protein FD160_774 [Caulobacteraceae bacterium]MBT9444239.1 hypothetical protein [Hyphomonadaceae bacterium]TPW06151.1 MAG: hypothetical protein FD124_1864 [Alphaproteobacteria bacterium]